MPATLTVHILEAKGLPVMDTGSNSTDAYVEVRLGRKYFKKSTTAMQTLNPVWDEVRPPQQHTHRPHRLSCAAGAQAGGGRR